MVEEHARAKVEMAAQALTALGSTPGQIRDKAGAGPPPAAAAAHLQPQLSDRAKVALGRGFHAALELGHNYIGAEHILLGLITDTKGAGATILRGLGITEQRARDWVDQAIEEALTARTAANTPPPSQADLRKSGGRDKIE